MTFTLSVIYGQCADSVLEYLGEVTIAPITVETPVAPGVAGDHCWRSRLGSSDTGPAKLEWLSCATGRPSLSHDDTIRPKRDDLNALARQAHRDGFDAIVPSTPTNSGMRPGSSRATPGRQLHPAPERAPGDHLPAD